MSAGFDLLGFLGGMGAEEITSINAPLSPRQELSFNHLAAFFRPERNYAADNKPSVERYVLAYIYVRCRFQINQSADTASALGRIEGDNYLTLDTLHVAERQEIDDDWWILNLSISADGSPADTMYGRWWTVRGQPQVFARSERRQGGKRALKISQEQNAPLGIGD